MPITVLDVPFEARYEASKLGAKYDRNLGLWTVDNREPKFAECVAKYGCEDYSYARWVEDDINHFMKPARVSKTQFTPHKHQVEDGQLIKQAYDRGFQGFLIASGTGCGKTLSITDGICNIAGKNRLKVLIVCPKTVIPTWRQTLQSYSEKTRNCRFLIINYQQLQKLIVEPKTAKTAKTARTRNRRIAQHGTPKIRFDIIVFDEAHYLKNYPKSAMSMAAVTLMDGLSAYSKGKSPFVISGTATPATNPLELAVLSPWLSICVANKNTPVPPNKWGEFLQQQGFHVKQTKAGWAWSQTQWWDKGDKQAQNRQIEQEHAADTAKIAVGFGRTYAPFIQRKPTDIAGWQEQQVIPLPLDLGVEGKIAYNLAWTVFRQKLNLAARKKDSNSALVETLRFRQKASLLKAQEIADFAEMQVKGGNQVFIGCEFIETVDAITRILQGKHVSCAEYSGRNVETRENERIRFQTGEAKVVLCTTVAGVSFHAGETLKNGETATATPRITIIADVRSRVLDTKQQIGRCHRDGQNSVCYIPYAESTIDERIITTFAQKIANMETMLGDNLDDFLVNFLK